MDVRRYGGRALGRYAFEAGAEIDRKGIRYYSAYCAVTVSTGALALTAVVAATTPKDVERMMPKRPAVNALNMVFYLLLFNPGQNAFSV